MQPLGAPMSVSSRGEDTTFQNSALYLGFVAEREEILRHKWIESEKLGHDIGFEKALIEWLMHHRSAWRASRQKQEYSAN